MNTALMDFLRIGLISAAFFLAVKFIFGSLITVPGLSNVAMAL